MERRQGRDHQKYVDEMMVILPFEEDFYKKHGVHSHFVGHPLLDAISDLQEISIEGFKRKRTERKRNHCAFTGIQKTGSGKNA
jgi:lipid A disaccharide synthetase